MNNIKLGGYRIRITSICVQNTLGFVLFIFIRNQGNSFYFLNHKKTYSNKMKYAGGSVAINIACCLYQGEIGLFFILFEDTQTIGTI